MPYFCLCYLVLALGSLRLEEWKEMVKNIFDYVAQMVMMFPLEELFTVFAVVWYETWVLVGRS